MSSNPPQPGEPQTYFYQPPQANSLGVAGFVVSLSGMIVCLGLICPIGLVLSLIALTMSPRGYAIAGCIIGLLGSILGALTILVVSGVIGNGLFFNPYFSQSQTSLAIDSASYDIDTHFTNNNSTLPDEPSGNTLISAYTDEWGNALKYEPTPGSTTDYAITSPGEDGLFATSDDMTQYYTAYNYNSYGTPPGAVNPGEAIEQEQIEEAFNLAAKKVVEAFPPGSPLPTAEQVAQQSGNLIDSWSMPMKYRPTDNPPYYRLESAGPDQQWGTQDDLTRSFYFSPSGETDGPL